MSFLTGPWSQVKSWFQSVKMGLFMGRYASEFEALAEAIKDRIQDHIRNQDLGWAPLSSATIAKKGFAEIYVETFTFVESVNAKVSRKGRFSLKLKVAPEGVHGPSGLSMETLASLLEFGTSKMPGRPLWRPVLKEVPMLPEFQHLKELGAKFSFDGVF